MVAHRRAPDILIFLEIDAQQLSAGRGPGDNVERASIERVSVERT